MDEIFIERIVKRKVDIKGMLLRVLAVVLTVLSLCTILFMSLIHISMTLEDESLLSTENMSGLATINLIIEELMNGESEKISENIEKLEKLRDGIIEKVQDLTCYVDKFNIYEHALNRVEYLSLIHIFSKFLIFSFVIK